MLAGNSYKKWENISALNHFLMLIFNMRAEKMMNFQDEQFIFLVLVACFLRANLCCACSMPQYLRLYDRGKLNGGSNFKTISTALLSFFFQVQMIAFS